MEGWLEKMSEGMFPRWQVRLFLIARCRPPAKNHTRGSFSAPRRPCPGTLCAVYLLHDLKCKHPLRYFLTRAGMRAQTRYVSQTKGGGLSLRHGIGDARCKLYEMGSGRGGGSAKLGEEDRILTVECRSGTSARTLKREAPWSERARWFAQGA
jgi:hypothetical protein